MADFDKKIIKHMHDYSRTRGEKYDLNRDIVIEKNYKSA